mmetsp:Transcript_20907/g.51375  ORF Transcript_20907/g.51375 Transcript_20907/m.51375 type:complete len:823 (+) Transcript_20907:75-2543(+)
MSTRNLSRSIDNMSYNYNQQGSQFDDPYSLHHYPQHQNQNQQQIPHYPNQTVVNHSPNQCQNQYQDSRQYGVQQHQQQGQYTYQADQPQNYSYQQPTIQNQQHQFQPHPPYSQLGQEPQSYSTGQHQQQPHPPFPQPPIQPHLKRSEPQQQLPRPTDPRNGSARSHLEQSNNKKKVPPTQEGKTQEEIREEKKKKKAEKKKKKKMKKAARGENLNVDSSLAEFAKAFKVSEYNRYTKKCSIPIPLLDKYRGKKTQPKAGKICIAYHCIGTCSDSCSKNESHQQLSSSERQRFYNYLKKVKSKIVEGESDKTNSDKKAAPDYTTNDAGLDEQEDESTLPGRLSNAKKTEGRMTRSKTQAIQEIEKSIKSGKRKADDSGSDTKQSNENKRQRLDLDDGRFDDCPDDDEVEVLGTIIGSSGTPVATTPSRGNDGTAVNPVDLTDSITPMTRGLYAGLPGSNSQIDPNTDGSIVISSSSSLELDQPPDSTTASVPTASSDDDIVDEETHKEDPTDTINSTTVAGAVSAKPSRNEAADQSREIPKLSLSISSDDQDDGNRSNNEAPKKPINTTQVDQMNPPKEPRKEVLSNSKSRQLKKLRAQLELAKKQAELAKLKKDQELQKQRSQDSIRPKPLVPISALSASLIIDNIHESGPENMVYFPNSEHDDDLQLTQYKTILYGNKEEEEATETLSARKMQIERDLAILKERLESSFPTAEAASMSREDLQRKLEEAQANKDLSYWKLFVSKQEHILSNVEKQIQENSASLEQCTEEMKNVDRESREAVKTMKVLKIREATLTEMAAKSSMKILQMRQTLHQEQTKVNG